MKKWDGEEEDITISGPAEVPSATCHLGKDQDEHTAAEAMAEAGTLIREYVEGFLGSRGGGGQIQHMHRFRCLRHKTSLQRWRIPKKNLGNIEPA